MKKKRDERFGRNWPKYVASRMRGKSLAVRLAQAYQFGWHRAGQRLCLVSVAGSGFEAVARYVERNFIPKPKKSKRPPAGGGR